MLPEELLVKFVPDIASEFCPKIEPELLMLAMFERLRFNASRLPELLIVPLF